MTTSTQAVAVYVGDLHPPNMGCALRCLWRAKMEFQPGRKMSTAPGMLRVLKYVSRAWGGSGPPGGRKREREREGEGERRGRREEHNIA